MDRVALDWLFSTAPQAIAALVGFIFAGVSFILGKIDDRVEKDETITEIAKEMKIQIYEKLKTLLLWATIGMVVDIFCLFTNRFVEGYELLLRGDFSWYFTLAIVLLFVNIGIIVYAIRYVVEILRPDYFEKTIESMKDIYKSGVGKISDFIEKYIEFEKVLRLLEHERNNNLRKPMTIYQLVREACNRGYLNKDDMASILDITKIRNIVIHGGEIQGIEPEIITRLEFITKKIENKIKQG